jgi:nucleoid-associated protein YgaU
VAVSTRTWTVRPGDSLWSIAETALSAAWGQPADARLLGHYWWQVVETNRASLPIPANPDLLFPGDKVVLPPPPARPGRG